MTSDSIVIDLEPQALDKKGVLKYSGFGPKIFGRMIAATRAGDMWLEFVANHEGRPGKRTLFSVASVRMALSRLKAGEEPPLLPCEKRAREFSTPPRKGADKPGAGVCRSSL